MIERSRQAQDKLILSSLDAVSIISETDIHGNITYVNKMFEKISGYSEKELIGKNHNIINSGFHPSEFFHDFWITIKNKKVWRGEILNKKKNGELYWVDSIIIPRFNELGEFDGFISIRYDITERVRLKEDEVLQHRFRSLGESTAQILHDIRNPLMFIQNTLKVIHRKIDSQIPFDNNELLLKIQKMENSSQRITSICKNMQILMHGSADQDTINLSHELQAIQEYFSDKFDKKKIFFDIEHNQKNGNLVFKGNSAQFQQVIINFVNNSLDAIELLPNPWIRIEMQELESEICLSVIDCGLGIDPKIQLKIWNSVFTTKDLFKGTGLGLGICKKIIESFKGRIIINNDSPNTRFDIFLPRPS